MNHTLGFTLFLICTFVIYGASIYLFFLLIANRFHVASFNLKKQAKKNKTQERVVDDFPLYLSFSFYFVLQKMKSPILEASIGKLNKDKVCR